MDLDASCTQTLPAERSHCLDGAPFFESYLSGNCSFIGARPLSDSRLAFPGERMNLRGSDGVVGSKFPRLSLVILG